MSVIVSNDFITDFTLTARSENTDYPMENVEDFWHLQRVFRANDINTNDWLLKFDLASAQTVDGVMLNHVNFNKVQVCGHATDSWGSPSFDSGTLTVSYNEIIDRYNIYIPTSTFNYRWLLIKIPTGTVEVGTTHHEWSVSSVMILDSVETVDMSYGYNQTSEDKISNINESEVITLREDLQWSSNLVFGYRAKTDEAELWTVNRMDRGTPMIYYENNGDTQNCYLARRDNSYSSTIVVNSVVKGTTIKLIELV